MNGEPLLSVERLSYRHPSAPGEAMAVDDVSISICEGETLGLVGESGCGKTTLARLVVGLLAPREGRVQLARQDVSQPGLTARRARARQVQMVFQDPIGSLNPRLRIGRLVAEPLAVHGLGDEASRRQQTLVLLNKVGLAPATADRYPHELSGGQRQRVAIARALALQPRLIVCDEAVSALDVSIQAQVLNLLRDLQKEFGLSYLFISHDLRVVRYMADRIAVMFHGRIVETGPSQALWRAPLHPYAQALVSSLPVEPGEQTLFRMPARALVPELAQDLAGGCAYRGQCPSADGQCARTRPELVQAQALRQVACWHA